MKAVSPIVSTHEYGPVILPPALDTPSIRERLQIAGLRTGHRVFEVRDRRLFARGVVGVIDIGQVIVEILPKTRASASNAERVEFLSNLVTFAGGTDSLKVTKATISASGGSLLEVVFAWAVHSIGSNLKDGMPRRYREIIDISTAVRGRVELRQLVRQRPGRAFELTVRHAPLVERNKINSVLKWLLGEIVRRTRSVQTRLIGLQIADLLSDIEDISPSLSDVERLNLTSTERHWAPVIDLAKTFLVQRKPDPSRGGSLDAVAVLFTLHDLFETAIRRIFIEGLPAHSLSLKRSSENLLHSTTSGSGTFRMRPDFCIGQSGRVSPNIVGDAKWKLVFADQFNLREADVYQLVTYMAAFGADAGFVVSPLSEDDEQIIRCAKFEVSGLGRALNVFGVRLGALISGNNVQSFRRALCQDVIGDAKSLK